MITLFLTLLAACSSEADDTGAAAPGPGTLTLSFQMDDDYIPSMSESPVGTFRGSIYAEADASAIGPNEGAVALQDLEVADVDLTDGGGPTAAMVTTEALDAQIVWILGCLDTDGNDCDTNDPITVPNDDKVEIVADADTPFTVYFGMLNPQ